MDRNASVDAIVDASGAPESGHDATPGTEQEDPPADVQLDTELDAGPLNCPHFADTETICPTSDRPYAFTCAAAPFDDCETADPSNIPPNTPSYGLVWCCPEQCAPAHDHDYACADQGLGTFVCYDPQPNEPSDFSAGCVAPSYPYGNLICCP